MYSGPFSPSFIGFVMAAVSQVVVEVAFLLVAPSAEDTLESGFWTLGVVANGLIQAVPVFLLVTTGAITPALRSGRGWISL